MNNSVLFAFMLSLIAGISTGIGGILCFFIKKDNFKALSAGLGFSAGVMIYVSFVEILKESEILMSKVSARGDWFAMGFFFLGILLAFCVDFLLPEEINQDELHVEKNEIAENIYRKKLHRVGLFTAFAISLHNFPEGLATFMAGMSNATLGISIALAISIHNIPEGIAVALPIYNATGSRKQAFYYSLISGITEPLGALLGYFILRPYLNDFMFGAVFAIVAGIMIYIAFDELLPSAREYGNSHISILGVTAGMLLMAISLKLF